MSGLLSNAISGLQASQNALRTTGHNISNANTPGYSRQRVEDVARPANNIGPGYIGSGVTTRSIERIVDEFVNRQLVMDTSAFHQLDAFNTNIGKLDRLLADENTGLSAGMQRFFAALQNAADDPSSTPARQLVLSEAESLSVRFNELYSRFTAIENGVDTELRTVSSSVNRLAGDIAKLNQAIVQSAGTHGNPNDLLDQRDQAIRELAELVGIETVKQGDGSVSIFLGKGHSLVLGNTANRVEVREQGELYLTSGSRTRNISDDVSGGKLGGLMNFKQDVIAPALNDIGRLALVLADQMNLAQQQGLDLNGEYGALMFRDINTPAAMSQRVVHGQNAGPDDRELALEITDTARLTTSDYQFQIVPGTSNYRITRLGDDQVIQEGVIAGTYPATIEFDGLTLHMQSGSFQGGDSFILRPTVNGAQNIQAQLTRTEDLALAAPLRTGTTSSNLGTGAVSQGQVLSLTDANGNFLPAFAEAGQLSPPVIVRFTSPTTYEVLDNSDPSNPRPLDPPIREQIFIPGRDNAIFASDPGERRVAGNGPLMGLPDGRISQTVAVGGPAQSNGYPAEQMSFSWQNPHTGERATQAVNTSAGASAAHIAQQLTNVPGVSATAFTSATLSNIRAEDFSSPFQITINGEDLLEYQNGVLSNSVPNPQTDPAAFNDYLVQRISENENLNALGLRAVSAGSEVSGAPELQLVASSGVNLDIRLQANNASNSMDVNDSSGNPNVRLEGAGAGNQSTVTVGGRVDVTLADGVNMTTAPESSQLFGDSSAVGFAQASYLGYQIAIKGQPQAGDTFTVDFNLDASNDNRNALNMAALETAKVMGGKLSFGDDYGRLVEEVGTQSGSARKNTQAAKSLMEQTQSLRDSVSGVNLDEEAANMIKYEQIYNANSRMISVARDLFDTLLNAV
ncbi:flagellar hook-associated protein FlgK [Marinimicrobium sp. ABcell2]|uniref:flagellar hook-associated protein FlgK n=1 Tax=Marinimicrobium sp. ABcell2 TaxID=3069751 RepID=UPI0027B260B6|nr:flagellar hook-associated protein FlgK [Marinimicrobium sp. ABcell2]MDQ2077343.1 flagellar hook-associated protein FlgK [Marinimicrobium sp. ABcell2]